MKEISSSIIEFMVSMIYGDGMFSGVINNARSLLVNPEVKINLENLFNNFFLVIGAYLMIIYFLKGLSTEMTKGDHSNQKLINAAMKFVLTYIIVTLSFPLFFAVADAGNDLLKDFDAVAGNPLVIEQPIEDGEDGEVVVNAEEKILEMVKTITGDYKIIQSFLLMILLIGPFLISLLINIYVQFILITREIWILVMIMWAPIALSNAYEGDSSAAVRYLRKFIAIVLQIVIIYSIIWLSGVLASAILTPIDTENVNILVMMLNAVKYLAVNLAIAYMIGQSKTIAEDIVGR